MFGRQSKSMPLKNTCDLTFDAPPQNVDPNLSLISTTTRFFTKSPAEGGKSSGSS